MKQSVLESNPMDKEAKNQSLEESIFKTLSNQKRRDILRFISEHKQAIFTEIKKAAEIEDSSSVSYHLSSLQTLVSQKARNTPCLRLVKKPTTSS
jgi:DNA-binding transcriptional ArsR family regulator